MKVASESKTKQRIAIVLVLVAVFLGVRAFLPTGGGPAPVAVGSSPSKGSAEPGEESIDPRLHLDLLANSEAVKYEGEGKNIFRNTPEVVEIPKVKVSPLVVAKQQADEAKRAAEAAKLPPPPPPINLKFFGFSDRPGEKPKVFLSEGEDVWIAHEGDVVNRHYKIVRVSPGAVEVEDLLNSNRQSIRLTQG